MSTPQNVIFCALTAVILLPLTDGFSLIQPESEISSFPDSGKKSYQQPAASIFDDNFTDQSRRSSFIRIMGTAIGGVAVLSSPTSAYAAADCMKDCLKNCLIIAPKVSWSSRQK